MAWFTRALTRGRRRYPHPAMLVGSIVVCLALLAGLGAWAVSRDGSAASASGPLQAPGQRFTSTGIPTGSAGLATFAVITLANAGAEPAVIDGVWAVPPPEGEQVRTVETWVSPSRAGALWAAFTGGPGEHYPDRRPARGARIPGAGGESYVLGLTLRPLQRGRPARIDAIEVRYHVGKQEYRDRWPDQVVLCPGTSCRPWRNPGGATGGAWPPPPAYAS
ncbi:MAG TPA: hypothetical protein VFJ12_13010 [Segeticoccus sp.]|nr:hypothetical protein [Segeticoccus sp.]